VKFARATVITADSTAFALRMIREGGAGDFFSRASTVLARACFWAPWGTLLAGNETLFRGFHCRGQWDFGKKYPVIRLSFAEGIIKSRAGLDARIQNSG
jgi:hypothetical protein